MTVVYLYTCVCLCRHVPACQHKSNCRYVCCLCLRAFKSGGVVDPVALWHRTGYAISIWEVTGELCWRLIRS